MLFAYPADLVGASETITSTGASVDPLYPLTNLHDGLPTEHTRFTGTAETRIIWDTGGAAQSIEGIMIVLHTFAAASVLKVEANPTNAWGAPAFTQNITVPTWPDHLPANITADFRGTLLDSTGYRFRSLLIPAQAVNHGIGEILWVPTWRSTLKCPALPVRRGDVRRPNTNRTSFGVDHVVERQVRQRRMLPEFRNVLDADRATLLSLFRKANGALEGWPVVLIPSTITTEEQFYVRFHPDTADRFEEEQVLSTRASVQLDLLEIQRGLPI